MHPRIGRLQVGEMGIDARNRSTWTLALSRQYWLSAHHQRIEIPLAGRGPHQVQAGLIHANAIDLQPPPPEREDSNRRNHRLSRQDRFSPEIGVFADREIVQHKARTRQQTQLHAGHIDRPSHGAGHQGRNPALIAADVDERRKHHRGRDQRHQAANQRDPAVPARFPGYFFLDCGIRIDFNSGRGSGCSGVNLAGNVVASPNCAWLAHRGHFTRCKVRLHRVSVKKCSATWPIHAI